MTNLNQRMLLELATVCVLTRAERDSPPGLINFGSKVLLQGLRTVGLVMLCVLRAAGINYIIAVDGNEDRLKIAESWVPR